MSEFNETSAFKKAIERVREYYEAGFKAALELVEQSNLETVKNNSDAILNELFGIEVKESDENVDGG